MGRLAVEKPRARRAALVMCLLALLASGSSAHALTSPAPAPGDYSVALEQCLGSNVQTERSATFVAQMVATAATQKMAMKIQIEARLSAEAEYHVIAAPGLGVWKPSEAGVKIYKYVKQVTNLQAPAVYRATVKFRWTAEKGRVVKRAELRSSRCFQSTDRPPAKPLTPAS
jgi:hypothetical protein